MDSGQPSRPAPNDVWREYVLLPAADVPTGGSRTEIVVNPEACLRVQVKVAEDGRLELRLAEAERR